MSQNRRALGPLIQEGGRAETNQTRSDDDTVMRYFNAGSPPEGTFGW